MTTTSSSIQVPAIDAACNELAITSEQKTPFLESTHKWRQEFRFRDGSFGKDLVDWGCSRTLKRLSRMALAYLRAEYGTKWWPPARLNESRPFVEYPRDETLYALSLSHVRRADEILQHC